MQRLVADPPVEWLIWPDAGALARAALGQLVRLLPEFRVRRVRRDDDIVALLAVRVADVRRPAAPPVRVGQGRVIGIAVDQRDLAERRRPDDAAGRRRAATRTRASASCDLPKTYVSAQPWTRMLSVSASDEQISRTASAQVAAPGRTTRQCSSLKGTNVSLLSELSRP